MKVSELKALPPKILIYGPAGRGKTALALTLGERCQMLDFDGNLDVGVGLHDNLREQRLAVDVKQFLDDDLPQKATAFARGKKYIYGLAEDCRKGRFAFDALAVDSLTAIATAAQNYVMYNSGRGGQNPEIQHWGLLLTEIENVVTILRSLPIPVVLLAHEIIFTSDEITRIYLALPGQKLPGKTTRMFGEVYYINVRQKQQRKQEIYLQTTPTSLITCRSNRGLPEKYKVATIAPDTGTTDSVSMWEILKQIGYTPPPKEPATDPTPKT